MRLTARQLLLLIDAQLRGRDKQMGELLLGPPGQQEAKDQPGNAFPGGEIYLSLAKITARQEGVRVRVEGVANNGTAPCPLRIPFF